MFEVRDDPEIGQDEPSWLADWSPNHELELYVGSPRKRLEAILGMRPCAATMSALEALAQQRLDTGDQVLFAKAWQRQAEAAQGMATAALADALGDEPPEGEPDLAAVECGLATRTSPDAMRNRAAFARKMRRLLPATLERWCAGAISGSHARVVDDATTGLTAEQARTLDARLAPKAEHVSTTWFRRLCKREAAQLDTRTAEQQHDEAKKRTGAFLDPEPDGMSVLGVRLSAVDGVAALRALNAWADALRLPGDTRTHGQRQAQALLDALLGEGITGDGEVRRRYRAEIQVGITLPALLGLRDDPGTLVGYGPIPAGAVRDLLAQPGTVLRRLVVDPIDARLIDYGRTRYRPDDRLVSVTRAKERTCQFPDCTRTGGFCDIDHNHAYDDGGETSEQNCHLLCRRHHLLKTFNRYRYTVDEDTGVVTWTTPLGFTYETRPGTYPEFLDPSPD